MPVALRERETATSQDLRNNHVHILKPDGIEPRTGQPIKGSRIIRDPQGRIVREDFVPGAQQVGQHWTGLNGEVETKVSSYPLIAKKVITVEQIPSTALEIYRAPSRTLQPIHR